ncbi:MAG: hypothetical protein AAGB34_08350 [Planctomycetota bacterium]
MLDTLLISLIAISVFYTMFRMRRATKAQRGSSVMIAIIGAVVFRGVLVAMEAMVPWQTILPNMLYVAPDFLSAQLSYWDQSRGVYGEQVYPLVWGDGGAAGNWGRSPATNQANTIINLVILAVAMVVLRGVFGKRPPRAEQSPSPESE